LTHDVVLTDLPVASIGGLTPWRFTAFRTVFVPSCRLPLAEVIRRATELSASLGSLAARHGVSFVRLRPDWYGFDPVHFRLRSQGEAWREILRSRDDANRPIVSRRRRDAWRVHLAPPRRRWLFGHLQERAQPSVVLPSGTTLWSY
jgi:hypothetical protein